MFGGCRAVPALLVVLAGVVVACGGGNSSSSTGKPVSSTPGGSPTAGGSSSTSVTIEAKGPQLVALDVADGHVRWVRDLSKVAYGLATINGLVLEGGADACGETQAQVRALDAGTGAAVWSVNYPQPGLSGRPGFAAADGVVVVSEARELVAFALQDGSERWRQPFSAAPRPTAAGDLVVVAAESSPPVSAPQITAFHLTDGSPAWTATGLPDMQVLDISSVGSVLFVEGYNDQFSTYVLDAATGALRWSQPGGLAAGMGDLAVTFQMSSSNPDANGGEATDTASSTPVVTDANGDIHIPAPPQEAPTRIGLAGIDITTGQQKWVAPGDQAAVTAAGVVAWQYGPPPVAPPAGGSIPFTPSTVTGLDPSNGTPRWTTQAVVGAVGTDIALLFPNNTTLRAVGVTDGQPRWQQPWPKDAAPAPAGFSISASDQDVVALALPGPPDQPPAQGCGD